MQPSWLMHDAKFGFYFLWSFWWVGRQVRKLRHRIAQMLFQAQNCASYIKKNQLQKKNPFLRNSEQEPGTQAFLYFCLIYFCTRPQSKRMKQLLSDTSKMLFLFFVRLTVYDRERLMKRMNIPILLSQLISIV